MILILRDGELKTLVTIIAWSGVVETKKIFYRGLLLCVSWLNVGLDSIDLVMRLEADSFCFNSE
jgi:hypothetical protein